MADYIKRGDVLTFLQNRLNMQDEELPIHFIQTVIEALPTADVRENVRGNWVFNDVNDCVCSVCGKHEELKNVSNYCPDCGAYMR